MSYLKDREIWLSNVPTGNPPTGYFWKFIQNGKVVVRDSSGNNQIMVATSGSQAITGSLTVTGGITGTVSSASYVEYSNVANKPTLVSGSAQVVYSGLTGIPSGIVSGSAQISNFGIFATTGSNGFNGSQSITGSLTVTGQVVAQTLNVQQVTSSIVYSSGSNVFGNSLANTQQFTGSVGVTGSLAVAGAGTFTGTLNGTNAIFSGNVGIGNSSFDYPLQVLNTIGLRANSTSFQAIKGTYWGYSTSYPVVMLGNSNTSSFTTVSIGYEPSGNANGAFSGDGREVLFRRGVQFVTPNAANNAFNLTNLVLLDGSVGIGTATPTAKLEIQNSPANEWGLSVWGNTTTGQSYGGIVRGGTNSSDVAFRVNNAANSSTYFTVQGDGKVGIGFTTLSNKLQVAGEITTHAGTSTSYYAYINYLGTTYNFGSGENADNVDFKIAGGSTFTTGGNFRFFTQAGGATPTERMRISSTGTSTFSSPNSIVTDGSSLNINIRTTNAYGADIGGTIGLGGLYNGSAGTEYGVIAGKKENSTINNIAGYLAFYTRGGFTDPIERMRITSGGDIFINHPTNVGEGKLRVSQDSSLWNVEVRHTFSTQYFMLFRYNSTGIGSIVGDGSSTAFNTSSDYRLKTNLNPINNALQKLSELNPLKFNFISKPENEIMGFLAHEVQQVVPNAVHGQKDAIDGEGNPVYQGIDHSKLIPLLTAAIQEQQTLIESLKSRIEILEQ